jgi:hypothetical protein
MISRKLSNSFQRGKGLAESSPEPPISMLKIPKTKDIDKKKSIITQLMNKLVEAIEKEDKNLLASTLEDSNG